MKKGKSISKKKKVESLSEAKKDPKFMKEIDKFIKVATSVYKL